MTEPAKNGDRVRVHYTGRLEDGQVFDSSKGGDPLEFTVGAGEVIPGFEEGVRGLRAAKRSGAGFHHQHPGIGDAVNGMRVGESKTIEIEAEDAYGPRRDGLVATIERSLAQFPVEPQVGMNFIMPLQDGSQIEIVVTEITDTHVTIDANHPLAGMKLIFDVELVAREPGDEGSASRPADS
jgi:peptidylprolyl isomerase